MGTKNCKILIIDDDQGVAYTARVILQQHYTDVKTNSNPVAAFEQLTKDELKENLRYCGETERVIFIFDIGLEFFYGHCPCRVQDQFGGGPGGSGGGFAFPVELLEAIITF